MHKSENKMTLFKKVFDSHFSDHAQDVEQILPERIVTQINAPAVSADPAPVDIDVFDEQIEDKTVEDVIAAMPAVEEAQPTPTQEMTMAQRAALAHAQMHAPRSAPAPRTAEITPAPVEVGPSLAEFPTRDAYAEPVGHNPQAAAPADRSRGRVKTRLLGFHQSADIKVDPFQKPQVAATAPPHLYPTGWIVVVDGPGEGNAMPIYDGVSTIGRGEDQALCLDFGDTSISRQNHAAIAYDAEQNAFFLGHGGKSNIIRLNDRPVLSTEELNHADILRIGETTLRFVALCGADFKWNGTQDAE